MAELAASIIGIVSAGTKVTLVLSQLAADVGSAGKEARMIASEIRSFCAVVKTLGETLEKVQSSQYYAHCAELTKDMTDASLEMFTEILDASESVRSMARGKDGKFGFVSRVQWAVFQKPKITLLRVALEAYKSNLALMLGTLNTAEKVSRKIGLDETEDITAEDEHDRTMLQILENDRRASLIEVEQVYRELQQTATPDAGQADVHEDVPSLTTTLQAASDISDVDLYADSIVDSAREEIASIRTSLSRASTFDSDIIHEQVSRYSERLSRLMTEDQLRISQRWSKDISLSSADDDFVRSRIPSWKFEPLSGTQNPRLSNQHSSKFPKASLQPQLRKIPQPPTPVNAKRFSILSDAFYGIVRTWLMEKRQEDRRTILGTLMNEVCMEPAKSPNSGDAQPERTRSPPTPIATEDKKSARRLRIDHLLKTDPESLSQYRRQARDVNRLITEQMQSFEADLTATNAVGMVPSADHPGLTLHLGYHGIANLPHEPIEVIQVILRKLLLHNNALVNLPWSIASCTNLRYLNLAGNMFKTIPAAVLELPSLEILDMTSNDLESIPETVSNLRSLTVLAVEDNKIKRLPYALGIMEKLQLLKYAMNPVEFPAVEDVDAWTKSLPLYGGHYQVDNLDKNYKTACLKNYMLHLRNTSETVLPLQYSTSKPLLAGSPNTNSNHQSSENDAVGYDFTLNPWKGKSLKTLAQESQESKTERAISVRILRSQGQVTCLGNLGHV